MGVILQHGSDIAAVDDPKAPSSWAGEDMDALLLG
jgi:hypothetical protein